MLSINLNQRYVRPIDGSNDGLWAMRPYLQPRMLYTIAHITQWIYSLQYYSVRLVLQSDSVLLAIGRNDGSKGVKLDDFLLMEMNLQGGIEPAKQLRPYPSADRKFVKTALVFAECKNQQPPLVLDNCDLITVELFLSGAAIMDLMSEQPYCCT